MANIGKIKVGGSTIYPATITQAVVSLTKGKNLDSIISDLENAIATGSLTIEKASALQYKFKNTLGTIIGIIDIPKDQFLKSAVFIPAATAADKTADATVIVGDPYLKFVFVTTGADITSYVSVKGLVDTYTADGKALQLNSRQFSIKIDNTSARLSQSAAGLKFDETGLAKTTDLASKVDKNGTDRLMTTSEGSKLSGIASGAQVNVIEAVKVNGTALPVTNKGVDINLTEFLKSTQVGSVIYDEIEDSVIVGS